MKLGSGTRSVAPATWPRTTCAGTTPLFRSWWDPTPSGPPRKAGLEAETYLEGMAGTIRGHWSKGSYVSHGRAEGECLEWRREWCMCPARGQSGLHPSSLLCCGTRAAFNRITSLPPLPPVASDPDGVCKLCPYPETKALPRSSQTHPISAGPPVAGFSIMFFSL